MERIVRWTRRIGQFLFSAVCLVVAYFVVAALVVAFDPADFPQAKGTPIGFTATLFALFFSTVSNLGQALGTALDEPVKLWELIVGCMLIVAAVKDAIAKAVRQIRKYDAS